jgi:hypothetical protein
LILHAIFDLEGFDDFHDECEFAFGHSEPGVEVLIGITHLLLQLPEELRQLVFEDIQHCRLDELNEE